MRLVTFLNESNTDIDVVKKETSQFFKEAKGNQYNLWRGTNRVVYNIEEIKPRTDRKPKDTPKDVHDELDDYFKRHFGWKARSEGVFVTSDIYKTSAFGDNQYIFIPKNGYKYIYSPDITDLTFWLSRPQQGELLTWRRVGSKEIWFKTDKYSTQKLINVLDSGGYKHTNLKDAIGAEAEISFYCPNGYYLVTQSWRDENEGRISL